jgi:hypothetical protein
MIALQNQQIQQVTQGNSDKILRHDNALAGGITPSLD